VDERSSSEKLREEIEGATKTMQHLSAQLREREKEIASLRSERKALRS
jgi:chromosome segregation ATPase